MWRGGGGKCRTPLSNARCSRRVRACCCPPARAPKLRHAEIVSFRQPSFLSCRRCTRSVFRVHYLFFSLPYQTATARLFHGENGRVKRRRHPVARDLNPRGNDTYQLGRTVSPRSHVHMWYKTNARKPFDEFFFPLDTVIMLQHSIHDARALLSQYVRFNRMKSVVVETSLSIRVVTQQPG